MQQSAVGGLERQKLRVAQANPVELRVEVADLSGNMIGKALDPYIARAVLAADDKGQSARSTVDIEIAARHGPAGSSLASRSKRLTGR